MILTLWKYLQSILILSLNFERFSEKYIIEQYISSIFQEAKIIPTIRDISSVVYFEKFSHQTAAWHERLPHLRIFISIKMFFRIVEP